MHSIKSTEYYNFSSHRILNLTTSKRSFTYCLQFVFNARILVESRLSGYLITEEMNECAQQNNFSLKLKSFIFFLLWLKKNILSLSLFLDSQNLLDVKKKLKIGYCFLKQNTWQMQVNFFCCMHARLLQLEDLKYTRKNT